MLKRLMSSGINIAVLGVSVVLFLVALFGLLSIGNAQKPETLDILAAANSLAIGDVISPNDLIIKTVFLDENVDLYITADESDAIPGSLAVLPIHAGQPIMRDAIISPAVEETRLSAALASYTSGNSLFPFPLDAANVLAPDIRSFLPGDKVAITLVIARRPQEIETATPEPDYFTLPDSLFAEPVITETPMPLSEEETAVEKAKQALEERAFPPLAKDLFPAGALVISVQGLPPEQMDDGNLESATGTGGTSYSSFSQPERLMLLIPDTAREELALALQQGNLLVVSLIKDGVDEPSTGFTYWDFEDLFKTEHSLSGE